MTAPNASKRLLNVSLLRLVAARLTSSLGDSFSIVAVPVIVLRLTHSASQVGIVLMANAVGIVCSLLLGGVLGDHFRRSSVMVLADLLRLIMQGLAAALVLGGSASVLSLAALQFTNGVGTGLFNPAANAILPELLPDKHLQRGNALLSFSQSLPWALGPAVAGAILIVAKPGTLLAVDSVTFAISASLTIGLGRINANRAQAINIFRSLREGTAELVSRSWLITTISYMAIFQFCFISEFYVLGPLIMTHNGGSASQWALTLSAFGVGSIVGGLVALVVNPQHPLVWTLLVSLGAVPILTALALNCQLPIAALTAFAAGTSMSLADAIYATALQQHIPDEALARVSAFDWLGSSALRPIGLACAGPTAVLVGTGTSLVSASILLTVSAVLVLLLPGVRAITGYYLNPTPQ